jgi:hypothetical protein
MLTCWYCGNRDNAKFIPNAGYPTFRPKCKVCGTVIWKKGEVEHDRDRCSRKDGSGSHPLRPG